MIMAHIAPGADAIFYYFSTHIFQEHRPPVPVPPLSGIIKKIIDRGSNVRLGLKKTVVFMDCAG